MSFSATRLNLCSVAAVLLAVLMTPASIGKTFELLSGDTPVDDAVANL